MCTLTLKHTRPKKQVFRIKIKNMYGILCFSKTKSTRAKYGNFIYFFVKNYSAYKQEIVLFGIESS